MLLSHIFTNKTHKTFICGSAYLFLPRPLGYSLRGCKESDTTEWLSRRTDSQVRRGREDAASLLYQSQSSLFYLLHSTIWKISIRIWAKYNNLYRIFHVTLYHNPELGTSESMLRFFNFISPFISVELFSPLLLISIITHYRGCTLFFLK